MTSQAGLPGRVAGIDYGTVRIGIAISDVNRSIASPFENYTRSGPDADRRRFQRLVKEEDIRLFVVGLPVHTSGHESQKSIEAKKFGQWLTETTGIPVEYYDERYTSQQAEMMLMQAELTSRRRKKRMDMLAAQIMLAGYLESGGGDSTQPLDD
jgi:putative Holliday junction resolvase